VDDWAVRKRHRYGTIVVDLERRRPIALLPERNAEPLAAWLREHPGVQVIARDRAGPYARGARAGAPGATQVADRFHLLQNLGAVLEVALVAHARTLRVVGREPSAAAEAIVIPPREAPQRTRVSAETGWQRRRRVHEQVWALRRAGIPVKAIADRLGIGRATVFRHLRQEQFPPLARRADAGRSSVDHWADLVLAQWNAGQRHGRRLYRALQEEGYRGSYPSLARYLKRLRQASGVAPRPRAKARPAARVIVPARSLTPRAVAWLVLGRPEKRTVAARAVLDRLRAHCPTLREIIEIAEACADLVRNRQPERLDPWLRRVQDGPVPALRRFAEGLLADYDAVRAAVTLPWSNGPVEGQINRLKMLKRQMYGRAGIDLLAKRFLSAA
jgi:transposase